MTIHKEATGLIAALADACAGGKLIGSMSTSIYDTAWASMVSKSENGKRRWLFPTSFEVLLNSQNQDGGWESLASETHTILTSLAGLLALCRHHNASDYTDSNNPPDLLSRISKAVVFIDNALHSWNLAKAEMVGFEYITSSLIKSLKMFGIILYEPPLLVQLRLQKLRKFDLTVLYGSEQLAILHSLEAFDGEIDFDKVSHHMDNGSFLGSPAATAAYLMNASEWSNEAEQYLQTVFSQGVGQGSGKFPCAFPSGNFELSWALSTFLSTGMSVQDLGADKVSVIVDTLEQELDKGDGCIGFATGLLHDADDTAKSILCLSYAHRHRSPAALIKKFDTGNCFKTYAIERNPSLSANCNVLQALLHLPDVDNYQTQVSNIIRFTYNAWNTGSLKDKWNRAEEYTTMLLAQALSKFISIRKQGRLQNMAECTALKAVPLILMQILRQLLRRQSLDGSWGQASSEATAYAVLAIGAIFNSQEFIPLSPMIRDALQRAHRFLIGPSAKSWEAEPLWIGKVCFSSPVILSAYCISAVFQAETILKNSLPAIVNGNGPTKLDKMTTFFSRLPLFSEQERVDTLFSLVEAAQYRPRLEQVRLSVFDQTSIGNEQYMDSIAYTWVGCNNLSSHPQPIDIIWDMMYASLLISQIDEYMETSANGASQLSLADILKCIRLACMDHSFSKNGDTSIEKGDVLRETRNRLTRFASHFLLHPSVQRSPSHVQARLRSSMETYLLAHATHMVENQILSNSNPHEPFATTQTYYDWVHGYAAENTSCPFGFLFFSCLVAESGKELFQNVKAKYFSEAMISHLATLCRQYNDYGSIQRDEDESNINSVNFPEFHSSSSGCANSPPKLEADSKARLMEIAEFEREGLNRSLASLEKEVDVITMEKVKLFVRVTDLYGQIYVAKDIANRVR
ncbi:hypothetical protein DSL72_006216 [Monilinia vaccinii-corymbosi]|uniref:Ent-kaurene synthase n=1 Tax=Monilinia vaccinii-corymbosi TaxID=61207 RepID=A0A8A3PMH6_9HELO|nr:hypothetical protein DSL72_006216 [Monilinia vaccinii-corymbosi]